jgi:predicted ribosomally synthesized peptide with SipW-like signal peptide
MRTRKQRRKEMITTKKKTGLLALAVALVAVLAVAGTLMLFTAKSETATNTVTLGTASIQILESAGGDYQVVGNGFTGFDYGTYGDDSVTKKPAIKNTGDVSVYVFVKLDLFAYTLPDRSVPIDISVADRNAILSGVNFDTVKWFGIDAIDNGYGWTGGFFYQSGPDTNSALFPLAPGGQTSDLFTTVELKNLSDDLQGAYLELKLTGYAVQSTGNAYSFANEGGVVKAAAFGTLLHDGSNWNFQ